MFLHCDQYNDYSERQKAVEVGFSKIVGTDKNNILAAMHKSLTSKEKLPSMSPFGDGTAAEKTADAIKMDFA